jgi:hypothetical protein
MNLTFAQSPSPSETSVQVATEAKTSLIRTSMSQLGLADGWKSLYSVVLNLIKKSFDFRTLQKSDKASVQEGDLTGSTGANGKDSYRAKKAYRFIAIVAYVTCVWAMRRAQRKALLEGTEEHSDEHFEEHYEEYSHLYYYLLPVYNLLKLDALYLFLTIALCFFIHVLNPAVFHCNRLENC